jgi:site-specific recombinase XerD
MPLTLSDAHQKHKEHLEEDGKAEATIVAYTNDVEQMLDYLQDQGKQVVTDISFEDLKQFKQLLKKRRYSKQTISRKLNSIKSFFRFLQGDNYLDNNPAKPLNHPKIRHDPPRYLSKMEYRALRDACRGDVRVAAIVELLLQTGMRISEVANLKMDDVDLEREVVYIQPHNTREGRRVPLNNLAKQALMDYLKIRPKVKAKALFLTKNCSPFLVRNIRASINRYFKLAGIKDVTVNDLRNTFIIEQLKAGTPLLYVSQLVGHKRITTTEKYLELIEETQDMDPSVEIEQL